MKEINEKLILTTDEFLRKYYDLDTEKSKMSFNELNDYLFDKEKEEVSKAGYKITSIKTEDILTGKYVLVKFKGNKVIAINTPLKPFSLLQRELDKKSKKELVNIRLSLLDKQGLEEDVLGFVYEKEIFPYEEYDEIEVKVRKYGKHKRK